MTGTRETIAAARSVVVKIGSSALTSMAEGLDVSRLDALADAIPALGEYLETTAVAQGDRLLLRTEELEDGTRLALLPPVAGG